MTEQAVLHYPTLKTVLLVEKVLQEAGEPLSRNEIKRRLPVGIMHQTLALILEYLEASGKVTEGSKGVLWIYNDNPQFIRMVKRAVRVR
jgi:hypothetical protein